MNSDSRSGEYNSLIPVWDPSSLRMKFPSASVQTLVMVEGVSAITTGMPPKVAPKPVAFGWTVTIAASETPPKADLMFVDASPLKKNVRQSVAPKKGTESDGSDAVWNGDGV